MKETCSGTSGGEERDMLVTVDAQLDMWINYNSQLRKKKGHKLDGATKMMHMVS